MKEELVEIKETYDKEGFLIKLSANDVPIFVPMQEFPRVKIMIEDTEWVVQKKQMTEEEFKNIYKSPQP